MDIIARGMAGESLNLINTINAEVVTKNAGENKYNANGAIIGKLNHLNGAVTTTDTSCKTSEYVEIPLGASYTVPSVKYSAGSAERALSYQRICYYDADKNFIAGYSSGVVAKAIVEGAKYVRVSVGATHLEIMIIFNTDGYFSADLTAYEPFFFEYKIKDSALPSPMQQYIHCAGDSLTNGTGSTNLGTASGAIYGRGYPYVLNGLITDGKIVVNDGVGGDKIEEIACRQGGIELFCDPFTIPDTISAVNITLKTSTGTSAESYAIATSIYWNPATINGVEGTINWNSTDSTYTFTRSVAGDSVLISRPVKVYSRHVLKKGVLVIFAGTNNAVTADTMVSYYQYFDNMISWNGNQNYIIIGLTSLSSVPDVANVNKKLAEKYGHHFLDIRQYLLTYGLSDSEITPTSQDTTDISNGEIPSSLRSDEVHFNDYGYTVIGNQLYKKGVDLGYWE